MNYVVIHRFIKENVSEEMIKPHVNYVRRLFDSGKLVITGPFTDGKGGGMFVLNVTDEEEMKQIVDNDPAIVSGIAVSEVRPYRIAFQQK
ncbi:MAG TPA: YciI family protein [Draconibacterium sp.]|nr:YciI family protein [Draconibacterium sp.]